MASVSTLNTWLQIHYQILDRFRTKHFFGYQYFAASDQYATLFTNVFGVLLPHPNQPTDCIVSMTGLEKLDDMLNEVKVKALRCYVKIMDCILIH